MAVQSDRTIIEIDQDFDEGLDNQPKENVVWDDFSFPVTNLKINPLTSKPDYNQNTIEYLFDPNTNETLYGSQITRHEFAHGESNILWHPHIHWIQTQLGVVKWKLEYSIHCLGELEPSFTTITTTSVVVTYISGNIHQISSFDPIDVSGIDVTACIVKVKITRLADDIEDTYTVDARFNSLDFHVPIDQLGSRQIFVK